jgi:hypothetical protein
LRQQLRLPGFQPKPPKGGAVKTNRGKKSKKAGWHLTLGLKDTIFAGIGVVGLMMMSFALGALAGRGDIYRAAYSWGLMSQRGAKVSQWTPVTGVNGWPPPAPGTAMAPPKPAPAAPAAAKSPRAPAPVAAKSRHPAPVTGSITPLYPPVPVTAKKKAKTGTHRDYQSRREELRRVRREVVRKLKFQNSFDSVSKPRLPRLKEPEGAQVRPGGAHSPQVRVARYRHSKQARAKVAELQKQGIKATIKKVKDSHGTWYIVYKPGVSVHTTTGRLARKPQKGRRGVVRKPRIE